LGIVPKNELRRNLLKVSSTLTQLDRVIDRSRVLSGNIRNGYFIDHDVVLGPTRPGLMPLLDNTLPTAPTPLIVMEKMLKNRSREYEGTYVLRFSFPDISRHFYFTLIFNFC